MSRIDQGLGTLGLVALGLLGGCSGADVSAGSEGDAVNLNRCYGADCGLRAQSLSGSSAEPAPCGAVVGPLPDRVVFESLVGQDQIYKAVAATDGSVWAVASTRGQFGGMAKFHLVHFSADGALLASELIATEADHTALSTTLAVDAAGIVTVGLYSIYAETADSELIERLTLSNFNADLEPVGEPRSFRGMASPLLATGSPGSVWLAGNAFNNAPHGAISRVTNLEPDWIQVGVPTAGQGVGGISGLTVADDGFAAVVARLNPRWESGPNVDQLGLATFDEMGNPLWTLKLPTAYTSGYQGSIGSTAEGNLVVAGVVGDEFNFDDRKLLVQSVSREGELGWAYSLEAPWSVEIEVRRESGRTFAPARAGLAVIDSLGETCRQFSMPQVGIEVAPEPGLEMEPEMEPENAAWDPDAEYIFAIGQGLSRFRVPE